MLLRGTPNRAPVSPWPLVMLHCCPQGCQECLDVMCWRYTDDWTDAGAPPGFFEGNLPASGGALVDLRIYDAHGVHRVNGSDSCVQLYAQPNVKELLSTGCWFRTTSMLQFYCVPFQPSHVPSQSLAERVWLPWTSCLQHAAGWHVLVVDVAVASSAVEKWSTVFQFVNLVLGMLSKGHGL